jgi:hypothetical protein
MRLKQFVMCCVTFSALACAPPASANGEKHSSQLAARFAQEFYAWYMPVVVDGQVIPAWKAALEKRSEAFSPELAAALKSDVDAQEKVTGEIVGLDFDPFLFSQDPCERYDVGKIIAHGSRYRVAVHRVCDGSKSEDPDVIAEVARQDGEWVFVNFHYPQGKDLVTTLKLLKDSRSK